MQFKNIQLSKGKEEAVLRRHPWIFSGAINTKGSDPCVDGDFVAVYTFNNKLLGYGHWNEGSIAVRIISFGEQIPNQQFWTNRFANAFASREMLGLGLDKKTNCYRLIHGEGDNLSGLIVDVYADYIAIQCHSIGMYQSLPFILEGLQQAAPFKIKGIYNKSSHTLPRHFAETIPDAWLFGGSEEPLIEVRENGYKFGIDFIKGQKTGFFLDQRENRMLLSRYSEGKSVLNTFCYSGGFSIYALGGGAQKVVSVDMSDKAIDLVNSNIELNFGKDYSKHLAVNSDVQTYLKESDELFDLVILDPPAYAKTLQKRHSAVQGYKRLNILGIGRVKPGGLLATFSCSQVVNRELFYNTVVSACNEAGRQARVLYQITQGPDHPVNIFHQEGSYLKGLILQLD
jgi:23S rRNA (cytosine1962-C5)-methyltransferase